MTQWSEEVECPGCGEKVAIQPGPSTIGDEPSGRYSIHSGGVVVHQCAEGTYSPPESD
ncbi:MAG: hypothetical protein KY395_07145 [Actinobacteria bacterium]|nr:hypothetical protein [Actinomycetota bacterium]